MEGKHPYEDEDEENDDEDKDDDDCNDDDDDEKEDGNVDDKMIVRVTTHESVFSRLRQHREDEVANEVEEVQPNLVETNET